MPPTPQPTPTDLQIIGQDLAIRWSDERENFIPVEQLRAASPSAENTGEPDLFGRIRGGDPRTKFPGVSVLDWNYVGNYAVRFHFSDGHQTGLYSFEYLRKLGENLE